MHTPEATRQLITEMAPNAAEIEEIQEAEDHTWAFGFSDESVMTAEWAEKPPRLMLTFFLGMPPADSRLQVLELLLNFSQIGAATGGVRGGMTSDGELTLIYDIPAAPLSEVEFRETVINFAELGRKWRQAIRREIEAPGTGLPAGNPLI